MVYRGSGRGWLVAVLLMFLAPAASAAVDLSMSGGESRYTVDHEDERVETTNRRLGINADVRVLRPWLLRLSFGRSWLTESGRALTDDTELTGQYVGVTVARPLHRGDWHRLTGSVGYTRSELDGDVGDETLEQDWWQLRLGASLTLVPSSPVAPIAGIGLSEARGRERLSGPNGYSRDFEHRDRVDGHVGARIRTGARSSAILIRSHFGASSGFSVDFSHAF